MMAALTAETQRRLFAVAGAFAPDLQANAERQARQGGVWIAAGCMFTLNRTVRALTKPEKERIYALKARFIERLYQQGYCIACLREKQVIDCWTCNGKGVIKHFGRVSDCSDCGGSGKYRTVVLYSFTFDVEGRIYRWYQPEDLVGFEVVPTTGEERLFEDWKPPMGDVRVDDVPLHAAIVEAWLRQQE